MTDDMQRAREFVSDFLSARGWAGQFAADVLAKAPHDVKISGDDAIELVAAALRAAPEGYVLVPVEPTPEMIEAFNRRDELPYSEKNRRAYKAIHCYADLLAARTKGVKQ